jgi:hypothetical protein
MTRRGGRALVASRMISTPLQQLESVLTEDGLHAGLIFLNTRVAHRCTAVYKLDGHVLHLVALVDKLDDKSSFWPSDVPLADSFCQFVVKNGPLLVINAKNDPRVIASPYRGPVVGYVGLPLIRGPGELFCTFCHYDFCEQPMPEAEYLFLHEATRLLPKFI